MGRFEVGDVVNWSGEAYSDYLAIPGPFLVVEVNPYDIAAGYVVSVVTIPDQQEVRHHSVEMARQIGIHRDGNNWNPMFFELDVFLSEVNRARISPQKA